MDFIGGTVKDGHVVPDEPLPEGTRVEIRVRTPGAAPATATLRNGHTKPVTPDTGAAGPDHPRTEAGRLAAPPGTNGDGTNGDGRHATLDGWSWEQAIAQAPASDWQRAREAQVEAEARERAAARAAAERAATAGLRRHALRRRLVTAVLAAAALTAAWSWHRAVVREHSKVKVSNRVVKTGSVELVMGPGNGSVETMQALSTELTRSPSAGEVVIYFGKPRTRLIYDRHSHSLTAIPGAATTVTPCSSFVSGPSFSKVTDSIIHKVAASGGQVSELSQYCGPPGKVDASNCS